MQADALMQRLSELRDQDEDPDPAEVEAIQRELTSLIAYAKREKQERQDAELRRRQREQLLQAAYDKHSEFQDLRRELAGPPDDLRAEPAHQAPLTPSSGSDNESHNRKT